MESSKNSASEAIYATGTGDNLDNATIYSSQTYNEDVPAVSNSDPPKESKVITTTATVHSAMHGVLQSNAPRPTASPLDRHKSYSNLAATAPYTNLENHSDTESNKSLPKEGHYTAPNTLLQPEKDTQFRNFLEFKRFIEAENINREKERRNKRGYPKHNITRSQSREDRRSTRSRSNSKRDKHPNRSRSDSGERKGRKRRSRMDSSSSDSSVDSKTNMKRYNDKKSDTEPSTDRLVSMVLRKLEDRQTDEFTNKDIKVILSKIPCNLVKGPLDIDRVQRHAKKLGKYPTLFTKHSSPKGFFSNFMYLEDRSPPFSHLSYIALVKQFFSTQVLESMAKHNINIHDFDNAQSFVYIIVDVISNKLLNANDFQLQLEKYSFTSNDYENPKDCVSNLCSIASQTGLHPKLQALKVLDKLTKYYLPSELKPVALTLKSNPKLDLNTIKTFGNDYYYDIVALQGKKEKVGIKKIQPLPLENNAEILPVQESFKHDDRFQGAVSKKSVKKDTINANKNQKDLMENVLTEIKKINIHKPSPPEIDYDKIANIISKSTKVKAVQEGGVKGGPCTYCGRDSHAPEKCIRHPDEEIRKENQRAFDKIMTDRNKSTNNLRTLRKQCILCLGNDHYSSNCGYYPRCTPVQESCPICERHGMFNRKHPIAVCLLSKKN